MEKKYGIELKIKDTLDLLNHVVHDLDYYNYDRLALTVAAILKIHELKNIYIDDILLYTGYISSVEIINEATDFITSSMKMFRHKF